MPREAWCRHGEEDDGSSGLWIRVGVENRGRGAARGCVGRLLTVRTDGRPRLEVDPVQLRWAGVPRSRALDAVALGRGQREYLNLLFLSDSDGWRLVTFQAPDFDPGFATDLPRDGLHAIEFSVFADNADTVTRSLTAEARSGRDEPRLRLT